MTTAPSTLLDEIEVRLDLDHPKSGLAVQRIVLKTDLRYLLNAARAAERVDHEWRRRALISLPDHQPLVSRA